MHMHKHMHAIFVCHAFYAHKMHQLMVEGLWDPLLSLSFTSYLIDAPSGPCEISFVLNVHACENLKRE